MSFKTKALGLAAATALSLSLTTGAMAQDEDSTGVGVWLEGGACSISVNQSNLDYGKWKWDGTKYVQGEGATKTQYLSARVLAGVPGGECTMSINFAGLAGTYSDENRIEPENFILNYASSEGPVPISFDGDTNTATVTEVHPGDHGAHLVLSLPNDVQPDVYTGTMTMSVVDAND